MKKNPNTKHEEDWKELSGTTVLNFPFRDDWTDEDLKCMKPIMKSKIGFSQNNEIKFTFNR